jgi:polysaccharide biosynthesis/export protein
VEEVESLDSEHARRPRALLAVLAVAAAMLLSGCAGFLPTIGPSRSEIEREKNAGRTSAIQVIDVNEAVTRRLRDQRTQRLFSETLGGGSNSRLVGPGDVLEVSIWEAAPATLFSTSALQLPGAIDTAHATTLPEQMVDDQGLISVPFASSPIQAGGMTLQQIESEIASALGGKANQPQVLVRRTRNFSANATVVGDVTTSTRVPLVPGNDQLLDAIAAAGGVREPVTKMTIQVTRKKAVYSLPLETIIRHPEENVTLLPGDVVTALFQPYSFTALGATGKNDEINFETQGITLAQALARSGGLIDSRSNPKGVFIFRLAPQSALDWPRQPVLTTLDNMVPVVFRVDLTDPSSFFLMQSFPIENRDVLYVSNAPVTEMQKFLNLLFTVAYPVLTAKQVGF